MDQQMIHRLKKRPDKTVWGVLALYSMLGWSQHSFAIQASKATYQFSYGNQVLGEASRVLSQVNTGWQYQFISKISIIGQATETSYFNLINGQVQSSSYTRQTKILARNDRVNLNFNSPKGQITAQRGNNRHLLNWQNGVLDDLNAEIQVREDLKHGSLKRSYWIADHNSVEMRQFVNEGKETIKVANGQVFDTYKIRLKHNDPKRSTIFWLAPRLDYLPVKVTHQDNSNTYGLLLKQYQVQ